MKIGTSSYILLLTTLLAFVSTSSATWDFAQVESNNEMSLAEDENQHLPETSSNIDEPVVLQSVRHLKMGKREGNRRGKGNGKKSKTEAPSVSAAPSPSKGKGKGRGKGRGKKSSKTSAPSVSAAPSSSKGKGMGKGRGKGMMM